MSMYRILAIASVLFVTSGCPYNNAELNYDELHKYCSEEWKPDLGTSLPDLAMPPPAKCAAAKGLTGDALICVDFPAIPGQSLGSTLPPSLAGWTFGKDAMNNDCWQIASGKLQVKNFGAFVGTCSFTMPLTDLASPANQKYQSVTLAVVQTIDLNPAKQGASAYLGVRLPSQQIWYTTGTNPKTVTSLQIAKAALPNGGTSSYQPLFELTSGLAGGATGWQIESIAVMGNP